MRFREPSARRALLFVLTLSGLVARAAPSVLAADDPPVWTQLGDEDGVRVWKRRTTTGDFRGFRAETFIAAPIAAILDVLYDTKNHVEWMERCSESWHYQKLDDVHSILYNRTSAPWPVADRDVVLDVRLERHDEQGWAVVRFHDLRDLLKPLPDGVIRMPHMSGTYRLRSVGTRTRVVYEIDVDIAGILPSWLQERIEQEIPRRTLVNLRARVEQHAASEHRLAQSPPSEHASR